MLESGYVAEDLNLGGVKRLRVQKFHSIAKSEKLRDRKSVV